MFCINYVSIKVTSQVCLGNLGPDNLSLISVFSIGNTLRMTEVIRERLRLVLGQEIIIHKERQRKDCLDNSEG